MSALAVCGLLQAQRGQKTAIAPGQTELEIGARLGRQRFDIGCLDWRTPHVKVDPPVFLHLKPQAAIGAEHGIVLLDVQAQGDAASVGLIGQRTQEAATQPLLPVLRQQGDVDDADFCRTAVHVKAPRSLRRPASLATAHHDAERRVGVALHVLGVLGSELLAGKGVPIERAPSELLALGLTGGGKYGVQCLFVPRLDGAQCEGIR